ncbi:MAG: hypothetical protein M1839_002448 [Geoglossum umbratile]|nr:MAG: hypothetical protein M1839_002448 [Geoglossum umbratile]
MVPEILFGFAGLTPLVLLTIYLACSRLYFVPLILYTAWFASTELSARRTTAKGIPWVGKRLELFSKTRANWRGLTRAHELIVEGYYRYSKNGKFFIISNFMSGPEVMVPPEEIPTILSQPENILSAIEYHRELMQSDYTFSHPLILRNPIHVETIRKSLTKNLGALVADIAEEIKDGFDEFWGLDTENWKEVVVHPLMMKIVARVSNRILVGSTLCRNQQFLDSAAKHSQTIIFGAMTIRFFPSFLKPLLARIVTLPNRYHFRKWGKHILPLVKQRIANTQRKDKDPKCDWEEPNDFLQWQIRQSLLQPDPIEHREDVIASRIESVNFAAIHTTLMAATSIIFDLYGSPPEKGYVETIREEAVRVLGEHDGVWTRTGLSRLIKLESAIKESLRSRGGGSRIITRKVVAPEGFTFGDGLHVPYGSRVGAPSWPIHHDVDYYEAPMEYDAFRFSRPREEFEAKRRAEMKNQPDNHELTKNSVNGADSAELIRYKNQSVVTTKDTYLPFGHGRHACAGRFFAASQLKLITAYITMNYEVEQLPERPPDTWFVDSVLPPMKSSLKVRRRKGTTWVAAK